jgi:hypothetical protein
MFNSSRHMQQGRTPTNVLARDCIFIGADGNTYLGYEQVSCGGRKLILDTCAKLDRAHTPKTASFSPLVLISGVGSSIWALRAR